MRVLLDTNVLISNLRSATPATSATGVILSAALAGAYTLLFTEGVATELDQKLIERPDLAARITQADAAQLKRSLRLVSEPVPRLDEPYPEVGRDRKDDFLLAHAIFAGADYLVSWDKDLLDLGRIDGLTIVSPPAFLAVLRDASRL